MRYGYMRVSTVDKQEFTRQEYVLKDYNLDGVFEEKISGTKIARGREEFNKMVAVLQKGDEVYFESMSRMARSMQDLIDTTNFLVKVKKVKVVFVKENISIGTGKNGLDAMGSLVFNIMGAFAQFERDLISDRTKQALRAKKDNGVVLGKPRKYDDEIIEKIRKMRKTMTCQEVADITGISRATVARLSK